MTVEATTAEIATVETETAETDAVLDHRTTARAGENRK
jgi:hypothetical protein